jgi:hypothetical protein
MPQAVSGFELRFGFNLATAVPRRIGLPEIALLATEALEQPPRPGL